jgi:hypothetical protein
MEGRPNQKYFRSVLRKISCAIGRNGAVGFMFVFLGYRVTDCEGRTCMLRGILFLKGILYPALFDSAMLITKYTG